MIIISNNSEGYDTELPIINVPDDYREWYIENIKNSDNAWYAPMNRSYAIKYARENGYKYLVQLDDNIQLLEIANLKKQKDGILRRYRATNKPGMLDDYIKMFVTVLESTNACMVGCQLAGTAIPTWEVLKERYVYSIFMLDLERCPDVFQGDFEDDIEFRLKCRQMGTPVVQVPFLRYGKVGQAHSKDLTGCRAEYLKAGLKRGEHMSKLYGDIYSCRMVKKRATVMAKEDSEAINFKHIIKPFKVGVIIKDKDAIKIAAQEILKKYGEEKPDKTIEKVKRIKVAGKP
ncbi:MAG: hypothetical protein U0L10_08000 [Lachnospiraceae bacterium]|nr:hypothetical protein [Lachnospiraceae bacterium]